MAQRILGMGDCIIAHREGRGRSSTRTQAEELERKLRRAEFTLDDFLEQLKTVRKHGPDLAR